MKTQTQLAGQPVTIDSESDTLYIYVGDIQIILTTDTPSHRASFGLQGTPPKKSVLLAALSAEADDSARLIMAHSLTP